MARSNIQNSTSKKGIRTPKQARSRATVAAILEACVQVLCEQGYGKLTVRRVAQRAGVSMGSLYQYFPNKEALVRKLRQEHQSRVLQAVVAAAAQQEASVEGRIAGLVDGLLAAKLKNLRFNVELRAAMTDLEGPGYITEELEPFCQLGAQLLKQHADQISVAPTYGTAFAIVHAIEGVLSASLLRDDAVLKTEEVRDLLVRMIHGFVSFETVKRPT